LWFSTLEGIVASTTNGLGTLSSAGIGSSLDVKGIVSQLMAAEQGPTKALNKSSADFNAKLSAIGTLKNALSTFQTAAQSLNLSTTFSTVTASVADSSALTATVNGANSTGSYNIEVKNLAQAQKLISTGFAGTDTVVGSGTLTLDIGTYSDANSPPVTFTADPTGTQKTITIDSSNNTLQGIRDAINGADAGVTATIIHDGTNYRLSLASTKSGTANAIRIGVAESGGAGLGKLSYDGSTGGVSQLTQNVAAQNAVIKVDGLTITKSTNTITDAIQGVTLNLTKEMASNTTTKLTLARDTTAANSAIHSFVDAYNAVNKQITDSTAYDVATNKASVFTGDATLQMIRNQLRNALSGAIPGASSGLRVLSDAGISFQTDGSLAINADKLNATLSDPTKDISKLFIKSADGTIGFGSRINTLVSSMIFGSNSTLNGRIDGINTSIKSINNRLASESQRLAHVEKQYNTQFSALDTMIANMTKTSSFLTQQLAALTKSA
jgi:flagellar hook-associated protein 2